MCCLEELSLSLLSDGQETWVSRMKGRKNLETARKLGADESIWA